MKKWNIWVKMGLLVSVLFVAGLIGAGLIRAIFFTFADNYEIVYRYDAVGKNAGKITVMCNGRDATGRCIPRTGYFFAWPLAQHYYHVDGRPFQVCITAIQRTLNCRLLQFDAGPNDIGLREFIQWHGNNDYDSDTTDAGSGIANYSYFRQAMMNYAYDGTDHNYPFLRILPSSNDPEHPVPAPNETPLGATK